MQINIKVSLKHRLHSYVFSFTPKINEDTAFASLETCTKIASHQTIKLTSEKGQCNCPFSCHTDLHTRSPF